MDKLVILAAGLGRRMQRRDGSAQLGQRQTTAADAGVKALIPIDRPFLDYVLSTVADAGYQRVCLVTGPKHDELRRYYATLSGGRLVFEFAIQPEPLGTAHALLSADAFAGDDPFAVINSDNYYPRSASSLCGSWMAVGRSPSPLARSFATGISRRVESPASQRSSAMPTASSRGSSRSPPPHRPHHLTTRA